MLRQTTPTTVVFEDDDRLSREDEAAFWGEDDSDYDESLYR